MHAMVPATNGNEHEVASSKDACFISIVSLPKSRRVPQAIVKTLPETTVPAIDRVD
jgi:hypothetical protein